MRENIAPNSFAPVTSDILRREVEDQPQRLGAAILFMFMASLGMVVSPLAFIAHRPEFYVAGSFFAFIGIGMLSLLSVTAMAYVKEKTAYSRAVAEEDGRVQEARAGFLRERGITMAVKDFEAFFPNRLRGRDGLIGEAPAVIDGEAVTVQMHERDGKLVVLGAKGRVHRPLFL